MSDDNSIDRVQDFQKRVLAVLEKPQRSLLLRVLNSAFFLWLASAIVLSFGGFYFSNYQQCVAEHPKLVDRFDRLSNELYLRQRSIYEAVANAKRAEDFKYPRYEANYRYLEFKEYSFNDVLRELGKVQDKIELKEFSLAVTRLLTSDGLDKSGVSDWLDQYSTFTPIEDQRYKTISQSTLDGLKKHNDEYIRRARGTQFVAHAVRIERLCTPPHIFSHFFNPDHKLFIARAPDDIVEIRRNTCCVYED